MILELHWKDSKREAIYNEVVVVEFDMTLGRNNLLVHLYQRLNSKICDTIGCLILTSLIMFRMFTFLKFL